MSEIKPPAPPETKPEVEEKVPSRGLGYRRDTAEARAKQKKFREHLMKVSPNFRASLPASTSLRKYEAEVMDQGQFGSCTGHGTAQGVYVSCGAAGIALGFVPSPRGIYANARCLELPAANDPLADSGAQPADVMAALQRFGVRAIEAPTDDKRYSDVDDTNIESKPTAVELEAEATRLDVGEYRIDEASADCPQQVAAALAGMHGGPSCAVGIGVFVDTAFMDWTAKKDASGVTTNPLDAPPDTSDPDGGGHWLAIVGYYTAADSTLVFDIVNSWGAGWGDGTGHVQVTQRWLMAALSDAYALTAVFTPEPAPAAKRAS